MYPCVYWVGLFKYLNGFVTFPGDESRLGFIEGATEDAIFTL